MQTIMDYKSISIFFINYKIIKEYKRQYNKTIKQDKTTRQHKNKTKIKQKIERYKDNRLDKSE